MKTVKQKPYLPIVNFDEIVSENGEGKRHVKRHGEHFPNSIRALICGPSNCGKTNVLFSLLFDKNGLLFENVYVYSKSLYQPKYMFLEKVLTSPECCVSYFPYKENDEIVSPEEAKENSIFVFDDVACDKQEKIKEFFSMGRHKNVDSFYLCQTYTRIPKHLIRDNANFILLFKQDDLNLRHVYTDHVSSDMTFDKFKEICSHCWRNNYGFITIDKEAQDENARYRKGFDEYIIWNKK